MMDTLAIEPQAPYKRGLPGAGMDAPPADAAITDRIHVIRGQKVMLDRDLAELYGVEVKRLKQAVRRNMERFPEDFMFELTLEEDRALRSQLVTLKQEAWDDALGPGGVSRSKIATLRQGKHSKYAPFAFTEHGILMLANVLRSAHAIAVSIHIIRVFARMSEVLLSNRDVLQKLEQLEARIGDHDEEIQALFDHLTALVSPVDRSRKSIGFKPDDA